MDFEEGTERVRRLLVSLYPELYPRGEEGPPENDYTRAWERSSPCARLVEAFRDELDLVRRHVLEPEPDARALARDLFEEITNSPSLWDKAIAAASACESELGLRA